MCSGCSYLPERASHPAAAACRDQKQARPPTIYIDLNLTRNDAVSEVWQLADFSYFVNGSTVQFAEMENLTGFSSSSVNN